MWEKSLHYIYHFIRLIFNKTFYIQKMERGHAKEMLCSLTLGSASCSCLHVWAGQLTLSVQTRVLGAASVSFFCLSVCLSLYIRAAMQLAALL